MTDAAACHIHPVPPRRHPSQCIDPPPHSLVRAGMPLVPWQPCLSATGDAKQGAARQSCCRWWRGAAGSLAACSTRFRNTNNRVIFHSRRYAYDAHTENVNMRDAHLPRSLHDLSDGDLLDRAFEPEFLRRRTSLEVELLWRLAAAVHAVEQAQVEQRHTLASLWTSAGEHAAVGRGRFPHTWSGAGARAPRPAGDRGGAK